MIGHDELIDLVGAYDERPCFLSVYADPRSRSDLRAIERRTNEVRKALKGDRHLSSIFEENL
ncbi:MAG TPA: hypothetical protein EYP43_04530, partial [Thermoplasmata archaeon]|nr:hypothetical protein [Thermoplasmata archaeon]